MLTLDDNKDISWKIDKFKFITKKDSKQLYIMYKNTNISFLIKQFEYEDGRFYCKFNIFDFVYTLRYFRYNNIWIADKDDWLGISLQPELTFNERSLKDAYNYFNNIDLTD